MAIRVNYEFKTDKIGRKFALKVDVKSGKKTRINYKDAIKLDRDVKYQRKRTPIMKEIEETSTGATYKEYNKVYAEVEKEIIESRKTPLKKSILHARVKAKTINERIGIQTSFKFMWVYRILMLYTDKLTGKEHLSCESPEFTYDHGWRNGNEFNIQKNICIDAYKHIRVNELCSLEGGACVALIRKSDKTIIKQFEIGNGCGFSFEFEDANGNYIYHLDDGYVCTEESFDK